MADFENSMFWWLNVVPRGQAPVETYQEVLTIRLTFGLVPEVACSITRSPDARRAPARLGRVERCPHRLTFRERPSSFARFPCAFSSGGNPSLVVVISLSTRFLEAYPNVCHLRRYRLLRCLPVDSASKTGTVRFSHGSRRGPVTGETPGRSSGARAGSRHGKQTGTQRRSY